MSAITAEHQIACTAFEIIETKPDGMPDGHRIEYVPDGPVELQPLPDKEPYHYCWTIMFYIAERDEWIGFNLTSYQERSVGPNEEDITGPYFVRGQLPLDSREQAWIAEGKTVERQMSLYRNGQLDRTTWS